MKMPCLRCGNTDRMVSWTFDTDFGGQVQVWGCRRCGIVQVLTQGERPAGPPAPGRVSGNGKS